MVRTPMPWLDWGNRFRTHIKEKGKSLADVAETLGRAESTLRSWTNDTRKINLGEFFELCAAAEVDPAMVLFGQPIMTDTLRKALGELTASIIEKDPTASPNYEKLGNSIRKSVRVRKTVEVKR